MLGKIRKIFHDKGYGFIQGEDSKDYFFHRRHCTKTILWDTLTIGDELSFDDAETEKGYQAENVTYA